MKVLALVLLLSFSSGLSAEIYDEDSEVHLGVINCNGRDPFEYKRDIHLDRSSFGKIIYINDIVDRLLALDLESRRESLKWQPPIDLHPSEGTPHGSKVDNYLDTYNFGRIAKCLVEYYRPGDVIQHFENTSIAPSEQKGFVVVRKGKIILRIITDAIYVD